MKFGCLMWRSSRSEAMEGVLVTARFRRRTWEEIKCDLISQHALWSLLLPLLLLSIMAAIMPGVLFRRSLVCLSSFLFSAPPPPPNVSLSLPLPRCRCSNQTGSVGRPAAAAAAEEKHVSLTESRTSLLFCSRFELKQTNRQKA